MTESKRREVFKKTRGRCSYCGCRLKFNDFEVDHIIPLSRGGKNNIENLTPSCSACNRLKLDSSLKEFKKKIENIFIDTFHGKIIDKYYKPKKKKIVFYFERYKQGGRNDGK